MRGNRRLFVRYVRLTAVAAPIFPAVEKFDLLVVMAFLMVLALLTAVVLPAIYSRRKARRDAALAVLDRMLPARNARERDLADVARKAIDEYIARHEGNQITYQENARTKGGIGAG
jgi:hypothetical protein